MVGRADLNYPHLLAELDYEGLGVRAFIGKYEQSHGAGTSWILKAMGAPYVKLDKLIGDIPACIPYSQWCEKQFGRNHYALVGAFYFFTHETDAMAFKLTFSDEL